VRPRLTFVDASVLIAAARGTDEIARRAMEILDDPTRAFASSASVRLEVLPKAVFNRRRAETDFYRAYFAKVATWAQPIERLVRNAYRDAIRSGLSAIDALHISAARLVNASELVTAERAESPLCRAQSIRVRTIRL
jgi:predicted nucleic acid-binding protein